MVLGETKPFCSEVPPDGDCEDQLEPEVCAVITKVKGFCSRPNTFIMCMKSCRKCGGKKD